MFDFFKKYSPIVLLLLWVALCFLIDFPWQQKHTTDTDATFHQVLLQSTPQEKAQSLAYDAIILDSIGLFHRPEEITLYLAKDTAMTFRAGDILLVRTQLKDGRGYVRWRQWGLLEHKEIRQISLRQGKLRMHARACRDYMEHQLHRYELSSESLSLIESLVLGDRRHLSRDQREAFADAGAMHVLAVSGLHVGIITEILLFLLTLGGLLFIPYEKRHWRVIQRLLFLFFVWSYAFLTGLSTPVLRSALMFSFLPLQAAYEPGAIKYNRLAAAALIILIINPAALSSPGFLLSFSAVLALMYFTPRWEQLLPEIKHEGPFPVRSLNRARQYLRSLLLASLAAQIGTLPWTLLFFGQSANYFFLTNLVVIPLAGLLILCAIPALLSSCCFGPNIFSSFAMASTATVANWMNRFVTWVQSLPGATSFFSFSPILSVLLILLIFVIAAAMYRSSYKAPLSSAQKKRRLICLLLASLIAAAMVLTYYFSLA